jgi:DNA-binding MarR family transcriptional regulator
MATEATRRTVPGGVIDELLSSPGVLLALLGQDAMRRMRDVHTAHELSPRQFQVLGLLHDHGAMGQRELGQAVGVAPSILVTLLNPLEAAGHVSRDRDAGDRRRHVVTLTPAGRRHLADAARAQREAEDELFAALTTEQRDQLRDLLIVLRGEDGCEPREPGCELAERRLG